jgi:type IV pilus assembly protein PilN
MILINLLPHREAKKKARKTAFFVMLGFAAALALLGLVFGYLVLNGMLDNQNTRNRYIEAKNKELDIQIKDIATLRAEIESLRSRQRAVEDLQADRNVPVHLFNELVKQSPEGIFLKEIRQTGQSVNVIGFAQSQERVSDFLRNAGPPNSEWLEKPDLVEIKSANVTTGVKEVKRLYEFNLKFALKRPRDKDAKPADGAAGSASAPASAPARPAASAPKV